MTQMTVEELNQLYREAEEADNDLFSEQRSNILLVAGEHYNKKNSRYWQRIRETQNLSREQKIRLTKNHIHKIAKQITNSILRHAPGITIVPFNKTELADQKTAELNRSVWAHAKKQQRISEKVKIWAENFVQQGEVAVKIFWDPMAGEFQGWEAEVDENGMPVLDESGQMKNSGRPVFSGDLVIETIDSFNLLRPKTAKCMRDAAWLGVRKMVDIKDLQAMGLPKEITDKIHESSQNTFTVFNGATGSYEETKGQVMVREYYFRKCGQYPNGYFYIATDTVILFEGELPFGVFPVIYTGWDRIATSPRHRSVIKQLRPFQGNINRIASVMAEHQLSLGSDKIIIPNGSKMVNGGTLPGIRAINVTASNPTIVPGRTGSQYLDVLNAEITEMYRIANVEEHDQEINGQLDPYVLLFRKQSQKQKFSLYGTTFEGFLVEIAETYLDLARHYFPDDMVIPIIGKKEQVNIAEFKHSEKLCYRIEVEPMSDDIETQMGKQLVLNHLVQYAGTNLSREDFGRLARNMPLIEKSEAFEDFSINSDNVKNDILALDRGEYPTVNFYDDSKYFSQMLSHRMRQPDFKMLDPMIQENYKRYKAEHDELEARKQAMIQAAKDGYIPVSGFLVGCDFYVQDPANPGKTRRARLPYDALNWLIQRLQDQGHELEQLEKMNEGALADIASRMGQPPILQRRPQAPGIVSQAPHATSDNFNKSQPAPSEPKPQASRPLY